MSTRTFSAGTIIYEGMEDRVETLDIITKGVVRAGNDYSTIYLPAGSIIGIGEIPDTRYLFTYEANDEVTVFSYPYESEASIVALFKANPKILSMLVAGCVRFAKNLQDAVLETLEYARTEYTTLQHELEDYPSLATFCGVTPRDFDDVRNLNPPDMTDNAKGWHRDFVEDMQAYESKFKNEFYSIPSIGLGIGLTVNMYSHESHAFMGLIMDYISVFHRITKDFKNEYFSVKNKNQSIEESKTEGTVRSTDSSVSNCIDALREFITVDKTTIDHFSSLLSEFMRSTDKYGNSDAARKLRRDIANDFYKIYLAVFLRTLTMDWKKLPLGIRMFLLFGYVDEDLAGVENTAKLAAIAESLTLFSNGRVYTMYEWLCLVYEGKVVPSKNEFNLDYFEYLRELKREGRISESEEKQRVNSMMDRVSFEIKNLFTLGNRITYGRITTFVPVFDKDNVIRKLEQCYLNVGTVNEYIEKIRKIDFTAFCRQGVFSMPEAGINAFYTTDEVLPYVILMPNVGSRAQLWQEIDSKKRNTPARMIISIFHTETIEDTMIRLVGEFRWEMCKTEQGVHWNDVTDPSLTSLYYDYLQFYRKNSALTPEIRDKISTMLKNNANNFKKVFLADYYSYIKYEANGALRLNKVARGILFSFCPFNRTLLADMTEKPQYKDLINKFENELKQKQKMLNNLTIKIDKAGKKMPDKIREQIRFWQ
ncbi:MAG: hypothetical protein K6G22_02950 [Lachnospiraceae bacterium]|nr:hypothetical protein [Lachnospiraceae bacterium]